MKEQIKTIVHSLAYGLFWSWNIIFLAFMSLGFAPYVLPEIITAVRTNTIPASFLAYAVILTAIPLAAVILGLTVLRRSPGKLLALGYGIEGPLMLMLAIRFFVMRELTPPVALIGAIAGLGMAALLWQILDQGEEARSPLLVHLRTVGLTLLLLTGLYASAWIAFYAAPIVVEMWKLGPDVLRGIPEWRWLLLWLLSTALAAYTATLLVAMPIAVPILYVRAWRRGVRALIAGHGRPRAVLLTAVVLAVCAALFVQTNQQPQHPAFAMLKTKPASLEEAQSLLDQQETIRTGLLNAYLAPVRYVSAVGEVRHVSEMYKQSLGMSPEQAARVQQLYEAVARPVLYTPVDAPEPGARVDNRALREEPLKAAGMYKAFFDQPIVDGERKAVVRAARSTWSLDQAQVAWQAIDDREIHLVRQEVSVAENGDWAEVELYEVYQNQTGQRQEVVYYFSLPESAVITGVWLGNSPNRDDRFTYRVSPRGAAQEIYRNEIRYNRDPALVEQIGPRQYRLRVFPVEPQTRRWDNDTRRSTLVSGPPLHMWLTYRVLADDDAWPLPRLAEKRNVYWDKASVRLVNGEPMTVDEETWLPESAPASSPAEPVAHRVDFPGGETILVRPVSNGDLPRLPGNLHLAAVLDRSRSMVEHRVEVKAALERLAKVAGADVDVYLTASEYRGEEPSLVSLAEFDPGDVLYYGGQNAAELLTQFDALHTGQDYDAILVLTDGSGYELSNGDAISQEVPIPGAPVWMVHLGGFPLGYDDATLEAIQASGGGAVSDVEEALLRLAVAIEVEQSALSYDVVDGYAWLTIPTEVAEFSNAVDDDFAAFAARRLILAQMRRQRGEMDELDTLDHLHAIAVEHSVVTPYSSMIVLVNEWQEKRLDELEKDGDRFQREYEEIGETAPESAFDVTGVPEPEEWLLIALAAAMLIGYARKMQLVPRRVRIH
jgi:putative PEP-CTERM system integral membrane protein